MNDTSTLDFSPSLGLSRRSFLRRSGMMAALSPAAVMLLGGRQDVSAAALPFPPGTELDIAILNFALNLEFLEGEYYTRGVTGKGLAASGTTVTGAGTPGTVTVKSGSTLVPFQSAPLAAFAAEIADDERRHIAFIQNVIADLGGTPIAEPDIDLLNSFNAVASMAGIAPTFDPFENEVNFYLGGYSLTDVGVTAYLGAGPLLTNKSVLKGASGILAVEAYHDATLRVNIYNAGTVPQQNAQLVSNLRDMLDDNNKKDKDQGVTNPDGSPNIAPTDSNSLAFPRSARQVLNIVYGGFKAASGGFFPTGLHGDIR